MCRINMQLSFCGATHNSKLLFLLYVKTYKKERIPILQEIVALLLSMGFTFTVKQLWLLRGCYLGQNGHCYPAQQEMLPLSQRGATALQWFTAILAIFSPPANLVPEAAAQHYSLFKHKAYWGTGKLWYCQANITLQSTLNISPKMLVSVFNRLVFDSIVFRIDSETTFKQKLCVGIQLEFEIA